jgi:hypothetical protein
MATLNRTVPGTNGAILKNLLMGREAIFRNSFSKTRSETQCGQYKDYKMKSTKLPIIKIPASQNLMIW